MMFSLFSISRKLLVFSAIAALWWSSLSLCHAATSRTITIGIAERNSPEEDPLYKVSLQGAYKAARTIFERQHADTKIDFAIEQHSSDAHSVYDAATNLKNRKVAVVVGGDLSDHAIVLGQVLGDAKIALYVTTATNPSVTENNPLALRACMTDNLVALRLAKQIALNIRPKRLGVIHHLSSSYSHYLTEETVRQIRSLNNTIVVDEYKYFGQSQDFSRAIETFKKNDVTHVLHLGYLPELRQIVSASFQRYYYPTFIGGDGWRSSQEILQAIAECEESAKQFKAIQITHAINRSSALYEEFKNEFIRTNQRQPDEFAALAFDAAWVSMNVLYKFPSIKNGKDFTKKAKELWDCIPRLSKPNEVNLIELHGARIKNIKLVEL
jgi:ABC-type branched-subunit amino acid transport system substrate-binding protein